MKLKITLIVSLLILSQLVQAQRFPFSTDLWEINARGYVLEMYQGKQSLYMKDGRARLKDFEFFTGTLEYDIYVTESRGFPGIHFRILDEKNFEEFYIRPHQSGNPDANQYSPVFNDLAAWQLYFGPRFSTAYAYEMNAWNHVKLVVAETSAEVYINNMEVPMLVIPELKQAHKAGKLGFQAGGPSAFHIADFKVTKSASPELKGNAVPLRKLQEGMIETWTISNPFAEASLQNVFELNGDQKKGLTWQSLKVEERGYANLSRTAEVTDKANTAFARITIYADKKQVKKLSYGVSDRGLVFLNDEIVSGSQNNFRSRDYRYLGTIGLFDEAYLHLKKGKNELWIAVSENFGGWGIMGRIEDQSGIRIE